VSSQVRRTFAWLGRVGVTFAILLLAYIALGLLAPSGWFTTLIGLGAITIGVWLAVRLLRLAMRHAVWRLRNRLIVTYVFIAVVPLLLLLTLAALGGQLLLRQLAVYMVTNELDRRIAILQNAAENIGHAEVKSRLALAEEVRRVNLDRYPGLEIVLGQQRVPADGVEPPPKPGWNSAHGVLPSNFPVGLLQGASGRRHRLRAANRRLVGRPGSQPGTDHICQRPRSPQSGSEPGSEKGFFFDEGRPC